MVRTMTTTTDWATRYEALKLYATIEGHTRVPTKYEISLPDENNFNLGMWVSYLRTRYRRNLLNEDQVQQLENLPGWEWGPLTPGPKSDQERDDRILTLYRENASLAEIGREMGLSRQRIHQIIKGRLVPNG